MSLGKKFRELAGKRALKTEAHATRQKRGFNFTTAKKIGLLYKDSDEDFFKKIRNYTKHLKEQFGVKSVFVMGFVDLPEKRLPVYQSRKLEFDFFSRGDLNWHLKPIRQVGNFLREELDILIDLSEGNELPLNFLMKASKASMKVGLKGSRSEKYADLVIDLGPSPTADRYFEQLNTYLSNNRIQ
ncbi:MAG: hypothetical protein JNM00_14880 [Flavobacteriales bacterium]|nr:hypothetical protein [Flavobacteriales bacterium]